MDELEQTEIRHFAHVVDGVVHMVVMYQACECSGTCGVDCEQEAAEYLQTIVEGTWIQTWIDGGPRVHYAHVEGTYDPDRDAFIPPQTYPSWLLNDTTLVWEPPVPHPTNFVTSGWVWDEDSLAWVELVHP